MKEFVYRISVKELKEGVTQDLPEHFVNDLALQLQYQGSQGWELCGTFIEYECLFFLWKKEKENDQRKIPRANSSDDS